MSLLEYDQTTTWAKGNQLTRSFVRELTSRVMIPGFDSRDGRLRAAENCRCAISVMSFIKKSG